MVTPSQSNKRSRRPRRWPGLLALALGLVLVVSFGWRAWRHFDFQQQVERGEVQVETLRGWMTLAYIERAYGVPQSELRQALGLPATGFEDRSIHDWSKEADLDPDATRHTIERLILQYEQPAGAVK